MFPPPTPTPSYNSSTAMTAHPPSPAFINPAPYNNPTYPRIMGDSYRPLPSRTNTDSWRPSYHYSADRWVPPPPQRRTSERFTPYHATDSACATLPARDLPSPYPSHHSPDDFAQVQSTPEPFEPSNNKIMPKYFKKPLTCFYWATQNGGCQKSDEECWYAHYWTGLVAAAPVRIGNNPTAIAGKGAERRAENIVQADAILKARLKVVEAREQQVEDVEEQITNNAASLTSAVKQVYDALQALDEAHGEASKSLRSQRDGLTRMLENNAFENTPLEIARSSVHEAIEALIGFKVQINAVAHSLKESAGIVEIKAEDSDMQTAGSGKE